MLLPWGAHLMVQALAGLFIDLRLCSLNTPIRVLNFTLIESTLHELRCMIVICSTISLIKTGVDHTAIVHIVVYKTLYP